MTSLTTVSFPINVALDRPLSCQLDVYLFDDKTIRRQAVHHSEVYLILSQLNPTHNTNVNLYDPLKY